MSSAPTIQLGTLRWILGLVFIYSLYDCFPVFTIFIRVLQFCIHRLNWMAFLISVVTFVCGLLFLDISQSTSYSSQSFKSLLNQYVKVRALQMRLIFHHRQFRRKCQNIEKTQKKMLRRVLNRARSTKYAVEKGLDKIETQEEFLKQFSVTDYAQYKVHVDCSIEGERYVLTPDIIDFCCATSGTTTGSSKLFPCNSALLKKVFTRGAYPYLHSLWSFKNTGLPKNTFKLNFMKKNSWTRNGVRIGPMSSILSDDTMPSFSSCPPIVFKIPNAIASFYIQLLYALRDREIEQMSIGVASLLVTLCKFLEEHWRELCYDIRCGVINSDIRSMIPSYISDNIHTLYQPDSIRAKELENEFERGFNDIIRRVWPRVSSITAICTGPFKLYKDIFRSYVGNVPVITPIHGSTESPYGANMWCGEVEEKFVLLPNLMFYEFIKEEHIDMDNPPTSLAHQVQKDELYELVVTTLLGLYRYRTRDVIAVNSFYHQCPVYTFMYRSDENLSIFGEKTPVAYIDITLEKLSHKWTNCNIINYAFTESTNLDNIIGDIKDMCYVIILEMNGERFSSENMKEIDRELQSLMKPYRLLRFNKRLGVPETIYTRNGAFQKLHSYVLQKDSNVLYALRVPRLIRDKNLLNVLLMK